MLPVLERVNELIADDLRAVERRFDTELSSDLPGVTQLVKHVGRFRGKMLRPMLVLLTGKALGGTSDAHITLATVVEMVHMATLVHDDVLDEAELRRKGATINHLRGNEAAVILGDYLISHSYHLCSSLDSQHAARVIAATTNRICEGELLQLENRNNLELTEEIYTTIVSRKTAVLCATCCALGAVYADAAPEVADRLERFGLCLGIAFQIQDDILDLVGDTKEVGKTLGIDIEKTKLTLPLIHFLKHAPHEHRVLLCRLLQGCEPDKAEQVRNLIFPSDSIDYARRHAERYIREARQCLDVLEPSDAKDALVAMADFVVARPL